MPRPAGGAGEESMLGGSAGSGSDDQPVPEPALGRIIAGGDEVDLDRARAELGIERALDQLDHELVGLAPVKERLRDVASLLLVDRIREELGLRTTRPNLHMSFTGPPGTGKTTVAMKMAEILHALGYLPTANLVTVSREDLVGQYVGHTAPRTKDVLKRAMGGVLFIDEAYALHRPENERDYGQESIEILMQVMEEQRDRLVVILAGYGDRMEQFFATNPGLRSRISHHIDFPPFTVDELVEIGHRALAEQGYELAPEAEEVFRRYVETRKAQPHFANARSIRNALDRARLRQATRLVQAGGLVGRADLRRIEPADLLASRVFREAP
ncbi:MAG: AAA family ATPase [Acidimicrobiales bacterium]|jgi:probable Rubsico expression protein CbbX